MGAHISALVVKEFAVDGEEPAGSVDRGAHAVMLLARVIGGDQMLAAVLDPFHRAIEPQRAKTGEHVLGIEFAAYAEAAAGMTLVQMHGGGRQSEHARQAVAIPMRHFGGAEKLEHVARRVVARDGAARLQRHAAVAADLEFERDDLMRRGKGRRDVAVALAHDRGFG